MLKLIRLLISLNSCCLQFYSSLKFHCQIRNQSQSVSMQPSSLASLRVSELTKPPRRHFPNEFALSASTASSYSTIEFQSSLDQSPPAKPSKQQQTQLSTPVRATKKTMKRAASQVLPVRAKKQKSRADSANSTPTNSVKLKLDLTQQQQSSAMAALSAKNEQLQAKNDKLSCQVDLANATGQQYKMIADRVGDLQMQLSDSKQTIAAQRSKLKETQIKTQRAELKQQLKIKDANKQTNCSSHCNDNQIKYTNFSLTCTSSSH